MQERDEGLQMNDKAKSRTDYLNIVEKVEKMIENCHASETLKDVSQGAPLFW